MRKIDLVGHTYGRLTVLSQAANKQNMRMYLCRCVCGKDTTVAMGNLRNGHTKSCGCLCTDTTREIGRVSNRRHGDAVVGAVTAEYRVWAGMMSRCNNLSHNAYHNYGGRGIRVCERWRTYENFLADMGRKPSPELSLDRIDNDGNYEPSNCRWATIKEQIANQRHNAGRPARVIVVDGVPGELQSWLTLCGLPEGTFYSRVRAGTSPEDVIRSALGTTTPSACAGIPKAAPTQRNAPARRTSTRGRPSKRITILGNTKTLTEWLADAGLTYFQYWRRTKSGALPEDVILDAILAKV